MTITIAPMEGVVDVHMRNLLTKIGGYDLCVTEFIRVSQTCAPKEWFLKFCPEIAQSCLTESGIPVHLQLMGGEAEVMAINAAFACDQLGAIAIDLNFGCPAKTVNRHMAGAALLQWPDKLYEITKAVNVALGGKIPLSAKMRLGFEDKSLAIENAKALEEAGAQKITVHARTKLEGYKPPAHWEWISRIRESVHVPVVANGEIWTKEDAVNCQKISGCKDIMIGRGAIARPSLAREIKGGEFAHWSEVLGWLIDYADMVLGQHTSKWSEGRLKQWIKQLGRTYEESTALFNEVRTVRDPLLIKQYIVDQYKSLNSF